MQVRRVAEENGVDVSGQIKELETRAMQVGQSRLFSFALFSGDSASNTSLQKQR